MTIFQGALYCNLRTEQYKDIQYLHNMVKVPVIVFYFFNRLVNNTTFAWKSLRLLARRCPHFFAQQQGGVSGNQPPKSVAKYLDGMLNKIAKELPVSCYSFEPSHILKFVVNH